MVGTIIRKIRAENFRNLTPDIIEFSPGINCIFGENGNGKTNLLEAIYYLTNHKSFRKNTAFPQMLNIEGNKPEIILSSVVAPKGTEEVFALTAKLGSENEEWWFDNRQEKAPKHLQSVFINPFDSYSFHTSASFRRQWIDTHLSQLNRDYKKDLNSLVKCLRQRNALLATRNNSQTQLQLMAIDEVFCPLSKKVLQHREEWAQELDQIVTPTFLEVFGEGHRLSFGITSKFTGWDASRIYDHYRLLEEKDFAAGHTTTGVHRDDCQFFFNGLNSFEFCSLGQQKMSFLSLLFAFIELFRYKFSFYPIVLIDDVSGELDSERWKNLIHYLRDKTFQVLITTANENFRVELEKIPHAQRIFMQHGSSVSHGRS